MVKRQAYSHHAAKQHLTTDDAPPVNESRLEINDAPLPYQVSLQISA